MSFVPTKKFKAVHIHTDLKFISEVDKFEGNSFNNQIVVFHNGLNECFVSDKILYFSKTREGLRKALKVAESADLVVLYDLDFIKSRFALNLPSDQLIAWRFFGHELYKLKTDEYFSDLTKNARGNRKQQVLKKKLVSLLSSFRSAIRWSFFAKDEFNQAKKRIDFFLGLFQEEYTQLCGLGFELPPFVRFPIRSYCCDPNTSNKEKYIIIGNNRSPYNNHLDIINIIDSVKEHNNYIFYLLFNYGLEGDYSKKIREAVRFKSYFNVIEEFLPYDSFHGLYQKASAAVFNGFRQMAMTNIFIALTKGVKVYLNKKNIVTEWLRKEGFTVYYVDDLAGDLENHNILLSPEASKHNAEQFVKFIQSYTYEDFQRNLGSVMIKNSYELSEKF